MLLCDHGNDCVNCQHSSDQYMPPLMNASGRDCELYLCTQNLSTTLRLMHYARVSDYEMYRYSQYPSNCYLKSGRGCGCEMSPHILDPNSHDRDHGYGCVHHLSPLRHLVLI